MNMKEKLESLGKNSIQLKIARKETYKPVSYTHLQAVLSPARSM